MSLFSSIFGRSVGSNSGTSWGRTIAELIPKCLIPSRTTCLEGSTEAVSLNRFDTKKNEEKEGSSKVIDGRFVADLLAHALICFGTAVLAAYLQYKATTAVMNGDDTERMYSSSSVKKKLQKILQKKADAAADKAGKPRQKVKCPALSPHELRIAASIIDPDDIGTTFEDIGGAEHAKDGIYQNAILPFHFTEAYAGEALRSCPMGVLLYGPPGTGKTLIAKAIAKQAGAVFIEISVSRVLSKWFGESNKLLAAAFSLANKLAPAVLFIDEIDTFLNDSSGQSNEHMGHLKSEFLSRWDGLSTQLKSKVLVLGASNNPQHLGKAILRRMPLRYNIGLPNVNERLEILKILLKNDEMLEETEDFLPELAQITTGYSGSELKEVCRQASTAVLNEATAAYAAARGNQENFTGFGFRPIAKEDLQAAIEEVRESSRHLDRFTRGGLN